MNTTHKKRALLVAMMAGSLALTGCFGDDDDNDSGSNTVETPTPEPETKTYTYDVTVVNATAGQPFSPLALIAHTDEYKAFTVGEAASTELEYLAESGSNQEILTAVASDATVHTSLSGSGVVVPGSSQTLTIEVDEDDFESAYLTVLTMMVNTNDAVVAARGINLSDLAVNGYHKVSAIAYDAGTEANSESADSIPGPAAGGEGFNAARDDRADQVTSHPGAVTSDDGLAMSALSEVHRWDNPAALITVTRTQ